MCKIDVLFCEPSDLNAYRLKFLIGCKYYESRSMSFALFIFTLSKNANGMTKKSFWDVPGFIQVDSHNMIYPTYRTTPWINSIKLFRDNISHSKEMCLHNIKKINW